MSRSRALVTVFAGPEGRQPWEQLCAVNWRRYGDRHGYDVVGLDMARDLSEPHGWRHRGLALEQSAIASYERVVLLDSAILINPDAGDVSDGVPLHLVGAVDAYTAPSPERHRAVLQRLYRFWEDCGVQFVRKATPEACYRARGLSPLFDRVVEPGVLVLSPSHHRDLVVRACRSSAVAVADEDGAVLSHALLSLNQVHWIDPLFNVSWLIHMCEKCPFLFSRPDHRRAPECAHRAFAQSHFLRFTGREEEMGRIATWPDAPRVASAAPAVRPRTSDARASDFRLTTPVALILYNREETTREVFAAIRRARPERLLLIADGPRPERAGDEAACAAARRAAGPVDWPCEVSTLYSDRNLGIRDRIDSGLAWVFAQCDDAVILEDDCVPDSSFFRYCQELLAHYGDDPSVMTISGSSFQYGLGREDDGYYFSRYPHTWGWATWRRAWNRYDPGMARWPALREQGWLTELLGDRRAAAYWSHVFEENHRTGHHWDVAWILSSWVQRALSVVPRHPLISNVGQGHKATHTRQYDIEFADLPTHPIGFPLDHPANIIRDESADRLTDELMFGGTLAEVFGRIRRASERNPPTLKGRLR